MSQQVVTQAPRFVTLQPNAERTTSTGGTSAMVAAAVLVTRKGEPGKPLQVTGETWEEVLGSPYPMSMGSNAEGLRHLKDALSTCQHAYVVRAVADNARYPVITINADGTTAKTDLGFDTTLAPITGTQMSFFVRDGDVDAKRRISITKVDVDTGLFDLKLEQERSGEWVLLDTYEDLGLKAEDVDDLGLPAFAETALESRSPYIGCVVASDAVAANLKTVDAVEFEGGTTGDEPSTDNIKAAWDVLRYSNLPFNQVMTAGQYNPVVIRHINTICNDLMVQLRADAPPHLTEEAANQWIEALNLGNSFNLSIYHYPYEANDEWFGGKSVWGVSGEAVAAKARCYATTKNRADVPGVHYAAGGQERGYISRSGIKPLHTSGFVAEEDKVEIKDASGAIVGRLNPVTMGKYIGDVLTNYSKKNYLRFEHVVSIYFAMSKEVIEAAESLKFKPDGLTLDGLERACSRIGQKYVDSEALVIPREPELDGEEPFVFKITQKEIDLWLIEMSICPTGVARRGALQPILMR